MTKSESDGSFLSNLRELKLVTFGHPSLGPFRLGWVCRILCAVPHMQDTGVQFERRKQDRIRAVLPVRIRGKDTAGTPFEELAHTLDLTPYGAKLGSIRRPLKALETLTILYRQRRMEFRVVWTKVMECTKEYQVGLKALSQEKEAWGLSFTAQPMRRASAAPATV